MPQVNGLVCACYLLSVDGRTRRRNDRERAALRTREAQHIPERVGVEADVHLQRFRYAGGARRRPLGVDHT